MAGKRKRAGVTAAAATNQAGTLGLRVVVVGDPGTGKSTLVVALTAEQFPEDVHGVIPPTCLHSVPITIIDTASDCSPAKLFPECELADAVVVTYACDQPATLERLGSFWLPELRRLQLKAPVIVVGCKLDLRGEQQAILEPLIVTLKQSFQEIEACIECSAHERMKVFDVFYLAQKAVLHPTAPLFDQGARSLKPRCIRALIKRKKIWDESAEALFCACYVDLIGTCKMLSNEERFTKVAQMMFDKSKRRYTHQQLGDKFKRLRSLYKGYISQEMQSNTWWEKKQRENAKFRNLRNGEALPNLELMKIIFEAEESTAQGESETDYSGKHDLSLQMEESNGLIENLRRENEAKTKECQDAREFATQMEAKVVEMEYLLLESNKKIEELEAENQKLFNEVQELKGNIRVYCRIRPFLPGQNKESSTVDYIGKNGDLVISNSWKEGKGGQRMFKFNKVFSPLASQAEVFSEIQPLIRSVLDGFDVCIFAYGQSGSGKTYTMTGPSSSKQDWGVNYRALSELFDLSQSRRNTFSYEVSVQMVEIYNEKVRDLLSNEIAEKGLQIRSTSQPSGLVVPHASLHQVRSTSHVLQLMEIGQANRAVGSTALNERSSRSHSILTIHVKGLDLKNGSRFKCCLHLIDLAGSERLDKSQATGDRLTEAQNINKSLSALGDVICALAKKSSYVPYRNSKLTQILQSSLGGQAKTLMFVQISPEVQSYDETISTLKFAERVAGVELGAAQSKKEVSSLKDDGLLAGDNASDDSETESFTSDRITDMATDRMHEGPSRKTRFTLNNGQPPTKRSKLKDSVLRTPGQQKAAPSNLTRGASVRGSKRWQ